MVDYRGMEKSTELARYDSLMCGNFIQKLSPLIAYAM